MTSRIVNPTARLARRRLLTSIAASIANTTITHASFVRPISAPGVGNISRGPGTTITRDVVDTVMLVVEALVPFGVTVLGEIPHAAP
jgi:hypothetical protein